LIKNQSNEQLYKAGQLILQPIGKVRKKLGIAGKIDRPPIPIIILSRDTQDSAAVRYVDVAFLQSNPNYKNCVFQVASNFNLVEGGREKVTPDSSNFCTNYRWDRTQGPTAAISAAPAAIVRVYGAFYDPNTPSPSWPQTKKKQVNILAPVSEHFPMKNGYVYWLGAQLPKFPKPGTKPYRDLLKKTYIGYHKNIQVTTGHRTPSYVEGVNSPEQFIDQVFGAAVNLGEGTDSGKFNKTVPDCLDRCKFALEQSYECAYAGSITEGRQHLVLTLIGGGAFNNDREQIYETILETHLKWTQNQKCTLEKVTILVFRSDEVSENFLNLLTNHQIPFIYEWYKADGTAEVKKRSGC